MKKVLFVISPGDFRDEELEIPKSILNENGIETKIVSSNEGVFKGMLGSEIKAENIKNVDLDEYDAIVFVGGSGIIKHKTYEIPEFLESAKKFKNKIICAICLGPMIPAFADVLVDKKITMWNDERFVNMIKDKVYEIDLEKNVVVDGNVITANGPDAAEEFGNEILKKLTEENQ